MVPTQGHRACTSLIGADEGGGEGRGQDSEGGRGGMGQWGEEAGEGAGESREHEGVQAERPDAGASVGVGQVSPLAARQSLRRCRSLTSCGMLLLSLTAGHTCPVSLPYTPKLLQRARLHGPPKRP